MTTTIHFKPPYESESIVVKTPGAEIADDFENSLSCVKVQVVNGEVAYIPKDSILYFSTKP